MVKEPSTIQAGLVTACFGNRGYLDTGDGERQRYILKGRRIRAVCGDRVSWEPQKQGAELLVTAVLDRDNLLQRPNSRGKAEALAANLSRLVVVMAAEPEPDFFIADRYLCAAELMPAAAVIVWNKTDLGTTAPNELDDYRRLGYPVVATSVTENQGITELSNILAEGISMLAGQSGVGKSSLINSLVPTAEVAVGELSAASGEGKHTTTASMMHSLQNGGRLIDTPGVREFAPAISNTTSIQLGYREISQLAIKCRFSNCQHLREPDCAVKEAVETAAISKRRYASYKRLVNSSNARDKLR
jgi:ribosome biogenesis GTPase